MTTWKASAEGCASWQANPPFLFLHSRNNIHQSSALVICTQEQEWGRTSRGFRVCLWPLDNLGANTSVLLEAKPSFTEPHPTPGTGLLG